MNRQAKPLVFYAHGRVVRPTLAFYNSPEDIDALVRETLIKAFPALDLRCEAA